MMSQRQGDRLTDVKKDIEQRWFQDQLQVEKEVYEKALQAIDKAKDKKDGQIAFKIIQRWGDTFIHGGFKKFVEDVSEGDKIFNH